MRPIVTVVEGAASRKLLDFVYVRDMLKLSATDISDAKLNDLIDEVSADIEGACNRGLVEETVSEEWRLTRAERSLWLSRWPVGAVTSITENSNAALDTTFWQVDYDSGQLWRMDGADGRQNWFGIDLRYQSAAIGKVVIIYRAGYVPADDTGTNVPADLRAAALEVLRDRYFALGRDSYLRGEEIPGIIKYQYGFGSGAQTMSGFSTSVERTLARYRRLYAA
jgi:hypothetical protein